jgi:RNA polymerase sigma-70 factor (ECF subfamily)
MTEKEETQFQKELTVAHYNYEKGLNAHAFFKIHDHLKSEDLVQDTFMKTWLYLVKGGKIDLMKAFLYHVLNNLVVDEYRKQKNETVSLEVLLKKGFEPSVDNSENLLNSLDGKKALFLIKKLPEIYQKVMKMRYVQDLSLKEMALLTGQSRNSIAVQAHRGLEKLKILYNQY